MSRCSLAGRELDRKRCCNLCEMQQMLEAELRRDINAAAQMSVANFKVGIWQHLLIAGMDVGVVVLECALEGARAAVAGLGPGSVIRATVAALGIDPWDVDVLANQFTKELSETANRH